MSISLMRSPIRTAIVLAVAAALVVLFLRNVDLRHVAAEIVHARMRWLTISFVTAILSLVIRSLRWQYLLEPLGRATFANAFRATCVGFAASSILPARAGEVIRPYFLARREHLSATGAFATIILERVLDMMTVLGMLASYIFFFRPPLTDSNALAFEAVKWAGLTATVGAIVALLVMFVLAGNPARLGATLSRLEQVLPSKLAGLLARIAEKFATGLGAIRRPGRLFVALALSLPLWLSIALGTWAAAVAFHLAMPFT